MAVLSSLNQENQYPSSNSCFVICVNLSIIERLATQKQYLISPGAKSCKTVDATLNNNHPLTHFTYRLSGATHGLTNHLVFNLDTANYAMCLYFRRF